MGVLITIPDDLRRHVGVLSNKEQGHPWHVDAAQAPLVWRSGINGKSVTVGIVDTGIDYKHKFFMQNEVRALAANNRWSPLDSNGHGTHVASIISSIAPQVRILSVKVLGDGGAGSDADVAKGIRMCVDNGANVINASLGSRYESPVIARAIAEAAAKGVPVFAAAGNDGETSLSSPAQLEDVLSVGAIDQHKQHAGFSNQGQALTLDCVGYGVRILGAAPGGGMVEMSGTSMATPWVVGVYALLADWWLRYAGGTPLPKKRSDFLPFSEVCEDVGTNGQDVETGFGLPLADAMIAQAEALNKPTPKPPPAPPAPTRSDVLLKEYRATVGGVNGTVREYFETDE